MTAATPPQFTPQQVADAVQTALRPGRPPVALSPGDAADKAAAYRDNLAHYRRHAQKSLDEGDYRQAAEKSWGAYSQTVKAIAAERRSLIPGHAGILRVSERLSDLVDQRGYGDLAITLRRGLVAARALHTHFYENDLPGGSVRVAAYDVATAVVLLQDLFLVAPPDPVNRGC